MGVWAQMAYFLQVFPMPYSGLGTDTVLGRFVPPAFPVFERVWVQTEVF